MPWRSCAARAVSSNMAGETPDLSGLLSGLLENPAALGTVAGLLSGLRGAPREESREGEGALPPHETEKPPLPPGEGKHSGHSERERLLSALCPYLSPSRRRALEGAKKLFEVLELFKKQ